MHEVSADVHSVQTLPAWCGARHRRGNGYVCAHEVNNRVLRQAQGKLSRLVTNIFHACCLTPNSLYIISNTQIPLKLRSIFRSTFAASLIGSLTVTAINIRSCAAAAAMAVPNDISKNETQHPLHPYYPLEVEITGYLANEWGVPQLLGTFFGGLAVLFTATYFVVKRVRPSLNGYELLTIMWFVLSKCLGRY